MFTIVDFFKITELFGEKKQVGIVILRFYGTKRSINSENNMMGEGVMLGVQVFLSPAYAVELMFSSCLCVCVCVSVCLSVFVCVCVCLSVSLFGL